MPALWSLFFDVTVMVLLGATIFYAIRLSRHLDHFRDTRADLAGVMIELSGHIQKAQQAIDEMRAHAGQSAINLQALISQAQNVSEELQLVNQASDALGARLEALAEKGRISAEQAAAAAPTSTPYVPEKRLDKQAEAPAPQAAAYADKPYRPASPAPDMMPAFSIRDPDMDAAAESGQDWEDENDPFAVLGSQAERDLASALRRRRIGGGK